MRENYNVVGKNLPLIDAYEKATGALKYAGDLKVAGCLHAKILRSPYAHARITHIDVSKAESLQGVACVITHKNTPKKLWIDPSQNWKGYVFGEELCCVGDEVAAVAAVDERTAEKALQLIEVEYEPLPAIFDIEEALAPDAPSVHPWDPNLHPWDPIAFEWGDIEKGFSESDVVVKHRTTMANQQHAPLDRNACIASWIGDRLTLWSSSQNIFWAREAIAKYFDLPFNRVRFMSVPTGGSFGFWWVHDFMFISALLAKKAKKPVRVELSREEVFTVVKRRETPVTYVELGFKKDGQLHAAAYRHLFDNGAHGNKFDPYQTDADLYTTENGKCEFYGVATNLATAGCMRGVGDVTLGYGIEQTMDIAAEKLGLDPVEIRLKNHFRTGDPLHTSQEILFSKVLFQKSPVLYLTSSGLEECIRKGAELIDWAQKWKGWGNPVAVNGEKRRGIGVAIGTHVSGVPFLGFNGAVVKVSFDGSVTLTLGVGRMGQGSDTTQAQMVAEILGVHYEDVNVVGGDTEVCGNVMATVASTCTHMVGQATKAAAEDARKKMLQYAAVALSKNVEELDVGDRRIFVSDDPQKGILIKDLLSQPIYKFLAPPEIIGSASQGVDFEKTGKMMMAHFVEVEADTETGRVEVVNYVAVHDSGTIVNHAVCENQVNGGVFMGCGMALSEDLKFDKDTGAILNPNYVDYKIMKAQDLPNPIIHFVEVVDEQGPFGAKGLGEGTTCPVASAVASALYNAVGVRVDPPISPERVLRALGRISG